MSRQLSCVLTICTLLVLCSAPANAVMSLYVEGQVQGVIEGDLTIRVMENEINVSFFSSTILASYNPVDGRPDRGVQYSPIKIHKDYDSASVKLIKAMTSGERLDRVRLRLWRTVDQDYHPYFTIEMLNAHLVQLDYGASDPNPPTETWGFTFASITWINEETGEQVTDTWRDVTAAVLPPGQESELMLLPPIPNPSSAETVFRFDLPLASKATLDVYDLRGRRVAQLFDESTLRPRTVVRWDGRDVAGKKVANGLYMVKLRWAEGEATQRMTLLR